MLIASQSFRAPLRGTPTAVESPQNLIRPEVRSFRANNSRESSTYTASVHLEVPLFSRLWEIRVRCCYIVNYCSSKGLSPSGCFVSFTNERMASPNMHE